MREGVKSGSRRGMAIDHAKTLLKKTDKG